MIRPLKLTSVFVIRKPLKITNKNNFFLKEILWFSYNRVIATGFTLLSFYRTASTSQTWKEAVLIRYQFNHLIMIFPKIHFTFKNLLTSINLWNWFQSDSDELLHQGDLVITGGADTNAKIWSLYSGECLHVRLFKLSENLKKHRIIS